MGGFTTVSTASHDTTSLLDSIFARCEGAYSDITLRGYRRDLKTFAAWCADYNVDFSDASPYFIAAFINDQTRTLSLATIKRRIAAIQFFYKMIDRPSPIAHSDVHLALRRAARAKGRRPKQVKGLTADILNKIIAHCSPTISGYRDAALISVGYDTLCRSAELSWMEVEHVDLDSGTVYIPRAKNDPFGDGRIAAISERTVSLVREWLVTSGVESGPLFRGLHTGKPGGAALETSSIRRLIKTAARRADLIAEALDLSGHSMRVGAAQDLMTAGYDTVAIMTAGGWKNVEVVARYVEKAALLRRPLPRFSPEEVVQVEIKLQ